MASSRVVEMNHEPAPVGRDDPARHRGWGLFRGAGALVLPADTALLAKWGGIVDAPPGRDWFDRLRNLWLGGRRLPRGMVLVFTIHPLAADRHALDDVEAVL